MARIWSDFAYVAPGTFTMGSPTNEPGRLSDETQHQVTLTHGIYFQTTEVTNQQYMEMAQWAYDHGYVTATSSDLRDNLDGSTQNLNSWCRRVTKSPSATASSPASIPTTRSSM